MIDTSKIRPGDTGTIKVRFRERGDGGAFWWVETERSAKCSGPRYIEVEASSIASHTPAPWVPEKGDVVWWNGKTGGPNEWEVLAVNGRYAWVGRVGDPDTNFPCLHCNLTLIRKGAA